LIEEALVFHCAGEPLVGVLHRPACDRAGVGVIVVVGGPQYRVGSHRQFVQLGRALAQAGHACLRFDYRGMGDSAAPMRDFGQVGDDIRAAVDTLFARCAGLRSVVLWGLCDGASASLIYAPQDPRVRGVVAVNPWVRSEVSLAQARVRHYYLQRLLEPELWKKVASGEFRWRQSLTAAGSALGKVARQALGRRGGAPAGAPACFQQAMAHGWRHLQGRALFVASGNDLTAQEFLQHVSTSTEWQPLRQDAGGPLRIVDGADHTFSTGAWNARLIDYTTQWLDELCDAAGRGLGNGAGIPGRMPAEPTLLPERQAER